jgi:hypothetical protein
MSVALIAIQSVALGLHLLFSVASKNLWAKTRGKGGMTATSNLTNALICGGFALCIAAPLLSSHLSGSIGTVFKAPMTIAPFALLPVLVYTMGRDISAYFRYKSLLRTARQRYRETGEKSDISVPGYASLNTLMLGVVVVLYGTIAAAAAAISVLDGAGVTSGSDVVDVGDDIAYL